MERNLEGSIEGHRYMQPLAVAAYVLMTATLSTYAGLSLDTSLASSSATDWYESFNKGLKHISAKHKQD